MKLIISNDDNQNERIINYYHYLSMGKIHFEMKNRICFYLIGFENINMYSKGTYLIKIQGSVADQKCYVSRSNDKCQSKNLVQKDPIQQYSKSFMIKYQNEKVDLNELFVLQTPLYKYSKETSISIKLNLYKVQKQPKNNENVEYSRVASTTLMIRFTLSSIFEYWECIFQEPFLSSLSVLVFNQPIRVVIETKNYKHSNEQEILLLKKEVKKLRYNNYLMQNKFKKIIYNEIKYLFTLPKMFVNGENEMTQVESSEEKFLNYLILYQNTPFTPEIMNYQLTSIGQKNEYLYDIFKSSCLNGTIFLNKLKMQWQQKQCKKYKQYISKQEHKFKFCEEYKSIIRSKLKLLEKENQLMNSQEILNNLVMKHERGNENELSQSLPIYPIVIHQVQRIKILDKLPEHDDKQHKSKIRYIFIFAHGYQGCADDLVYIANGLKRKYRKSKYLILKSYQSKMDQSLVEMAKIAEEEVNTYLNTFNFAEKDFRIVMIGHSMGGLILRSIASTISYQQSLYAFISMGTPHLGYLQGIKFFIKAGISFLSNISHNPCLSELSSKDNNDLHECLIYKLSLTAPLSNFKKIMLLSSVHDKYVSWHSARVQNYNKDALKQYNFIQREMIENIFGKQNKIERIDRIQVEFKSAENNMDKIIGRSSHIKFLNDHQFLELFINGCVYPILED